jgi:cytochrome c-type biogenesis protein CcmE
MKRRTSPTPKARRRGRIATLAIILAFLGLAAFLALKGFQQNVIYFITPSDLEGRVPSEGEQFRLGGLVAEGSVAREPGTLVTDFVVTDGGATVLVRYEGILPDLFREGQGVIAEGAFGRGSVFIATRVLAKHDEKYMPPEVADALKKRGLWKDKGKTD